MRIFFLVFFLLSTSLAWAGEEKKPLHRADFAYGMELSVSGQGALYGLLLPAMVYQSCTRPDLGDLRVFNAHGLVPYLIRPQVRKKNIPPAVVLPFFPLMGGEGDTRLPPNLHIATGSMGTIIDIRQGQGEKPATVVTSYIIDTSSLQEKADWLEFTWSGPSDHFSTSVQVETSDDLNSWRTTVAKAPLAELRFAGHDLLRNRIALPGATRKYLRLSWPAGQEGVVLSAVKAGYDQEDVRQARAVEALSGQQAAESKAGKMIYHFKTAGFFPVDQVYVRLPQQNSLAQVDVFSRTSSEGPWRQRASLLSYQLTVDGVRLDSGVKHISPSTDRFWRLVIDAPAASTASPILELGWLPQQLVFVAQGQGPYMLAYGRDGLGSERSPVDRLLTSIDPDQDKNLVRPAYAGGQIILGGKGQLLPSPEIPWRRWLLWASLVVGVLIIGAMAFQLFKEMKATGNPDSD